MFCFFKKNEKFLICLKLKWQCYFISNFLTVNIISGKPKFLVGLKESLKAKINLKAAPIKGGTFWYYFMKWCSYRNAQSPFYPIHARIDNNFLMFTKTQYFKQIPEGICIQNPADVQSSFFIV